MKILLGVTGSVAAKLTPQVVRELKVAGHEVEVIATRSSFYFWHEADTNTRVWHEADEWPGNLYIKDQVVLHIELMKWADAIVIAPLSANTLAKIANGLCDNLLTSVMRAWDLNKPVVLAPAMNTNMWDHPTTEQHLSVLRKWYKFLYVVEPASKMLACGDIGKGAMADIGDIVGTVNNIKGKGPL